MPFEEFLQTRLFKPLGMVDTAFSVPLEKLDRFAALYLLHKEGRMKGDKEIEKKTEGEKEKGIKGDKDRKMRLERVEKDPPLKNGEVRFFPGGGGKLVSTAPDYMRFCQMLLNGGELEGVRILKKETVELMRSPHHDTWFGLGFAIVADKKESTDNKEPKGTPESIGSYSWGGAAGTTFWIDPEKELIGLLMTQISDVSSSHDQFKKLTYQALSE